ncbi:MAG: GNAT family N-acetyltransferase [Bdellovibrionales bacterium]|nr:GNAT family N-acetyltransferase [Bdellovibrionales bacterium]
MSSIKTIPTQRLVLREFSLADAPEVQRLAGDWRVAKTTLAIPHPYPDGAAESWISTHRQRLEEERAVILAVTLGGALIGCVGVEKYGDGSGRAELGYWVGVPWWGKGYCTEAVAAVVHELPNILPGVREVVAHYMLENPASGRVMEKVGMKKADAARTDFGGRCAGKPVGCYSLDFPLS